jgi:hypothetical protein
MKKKQIMQKKESLNRKLNIHANPYSERSNNMAKKTAAELLQEAQALVKKAKELEKVERQELIEGLGKLAVNYIKGDLKYDDFIAETEIISGWKFAGDRPGKRPFGNPGNTEISALA